MKSTKVALCIALSLGAGRLSADVLTPNDLTAPFAVQPSAGLFVTAGTTGPFFSALASPPFTLPGIIDILANGGYSLDSGSYNL